MNAFVQKLAPADLFSDEILSSWNTDPKTNENRNNSWNSITSRLKSSRSFSSKANDKLSGIDGFDVLQRAQWPTLSICYKSAIFICLHKAFHDRLPVTLIDLISKKRTTNYSTRTFASLIVPRFNTRYMKDSVAFRGSVLWNAVTNNCSALAKNIPYRDLRLKLKSQVNFNEFSFKITSASTCNFRKDDFVYT